MVVTSMQWCQAPIQTQGECALVDNVGGGCYLCAVAALATVVGEMEGVVQAMATDAACWQAVRAAGHIASAVNDVAKQLRAVPRTYAGRWRQLVSAFLQGQVACALTARQLASGFCTQSICHRCSLW